MSYKVYTYNVTKNSKKSYPAVEEAQAAAERWAKIGRNVWAEVHDTDTGAVVWSSRQPAADDRWAALKAKIEAYQAEILKPVEEYTTDGSSYEWGKVGALKKVLRFMDELESEATDGDQH